VTSGKPVQQDSFHPFLRRPKGGDGVAVKAAGWNGAYFAGAEKLQLDCGQPEIAVNPGAGFNNNPSISLLTNTLAETLHIYFTAPDVNAAGMDLQSHFTAGLVNITVYGWDGTTVLGTTVAAATNAGVFWGVTADQPIGRITIHSPTNQAEGIDNLTFGHVGPCAAPDNLPWLSVSATNGTTAPGASDGIQVSFNTAGLTIGNTYTGTLCVNSNDPQKPRVAVPLALTVEMNRLYLPVVIR
jgi:hypothetical protein